MKVFKRILSKVYNSHISLILETPVWVNGNGQAENIRAEKTEDMRKIFNFYNRMGRNDFTFPYIEKLLSGGDFYAAYDGGDIVSCLYAARGCILLENPSFYALSEKYNSPVRLDDDTVYIGFCITEQESRGKGYFKQLYNYAANEYAALGFKHILMTTGADNYTMINFVSRAGGNIVGAVELKNILSLRRKKEIFFNPFLRIWR